MAQLSNSVVCQTSQVSAHLEAKGAEGAVGENARLAAPAITTAQRCLFLRAAFSLNSFYEISRIFGGLKWMGLI